MYYPSMKDARALAAAGECGRIPATRELLSDYTTPIQALRVLRAKGGHCFLPESSADNAGWGRRTFLGFEPSIEVTCKDGVLRLRSQNVTCTENRAPAPFLRKLLAAGQDHSLPRPRPSGGRRHHL